MRWKVSAEAAFGSVCKELWDPPQPLDLVRFWYIPF